MAEQWRRLPDAELEVMLAVWNSELPVSAGAILATLEGRRTWALPTLMTVLVRLTNKGFLICEKAGRNNFYHSAVTEEQYRQAEGKTMLEKLYGNSVRDLVASLYDGKAIGRDDLAELRSFLDRLEDESC